MKWFRAQYVLFAFICLTSCASNEEQLKKEREEHQEDLDKLKLEMKKKSDSFQADRSLSQDSAFRKRVEWLAGDIRKIEVKMDTIDAQLIRMTSEESEEEKEEKERENMNQKR